MKTTIAIVMALVLTAVFGCQSSGARGGGASTDEGFRIGVPSMDTDIKQGELQTVTTSVNRGDYFKRDVTLDISTTEGLKVEPSNIVVKASDVPDVQLRLTAARNAALGDYRVLVKGTPEDGQATSAAFTVKVIAQ
jgi:uncharacterized membrane protein